MKKLDTVTYFFPYTIINLKLITLYALTEYAPSFFFLASILNDRYKSEAKFGSSARKSLGRSYFTFIPFLFKCFLKFGKQSDMHTEREKGEREKRKRERERERTSSY